MINNIMSWPRVDKDEYYTPSIVWKAINNYLPKNNDDTIIYEPFYGNGHTYKYLKQKYTNVLGKKSLDFFSKESDKYLKQCNYVISRYSTKFKTLKYLSSSIPRRVDISNN